MEWLKNMFMKHCETQPCEKANPQENPVNSDDLIVSKVLKNIESNHEKYNSDLREDYLTFVHKDKKDNIIILSKHYSLHGISSYAINLYDGTKKLAEFCVNDKENIEIFESLFSKKEFEENAIKKQKLETFLKELYNE